MGPDLLSFDSRFPAPPPLPPVRPRADRDATEPGKPATADSVAIRASMLSVSVQFHLEKGAQGAAADALGIRKLDLEVRYRRIEISVEPPDGEDDAEELPPGVRKLLDHFSPERTARRIADFVTRGFARTSFGSEDTPESRRSFVDFILPYIRQGVDGALAMFGELPDEVRDQAEATFGMVRDLLGRFAEPESV